MWTLLLDPATRFSYNAVAYLEGNKKETCCNSLRIAILPTYFLQVNLIDEIPPGRIKPRFYVWLLHISLITLTEILPAAPATSSSSPRIGVKQSPDVAISNDALAPTVAR